MAASLTTDGIVWDTTNSPAQSAGTGVSNVLDDYEEGTWTPTIAFGGASVSVTYNTRHGGYTKIGNIVTGSFRCILTSKGSSSGTINWTGLPFTCLSTEGQYYACGVVCYVGGWADNFLGGTGGNAIFTIDVGGSDIKARQVDTTGEPAAISSGSCGNTSDIIMQWQYWG